MKAYLEQMVQFADKYGMQSDLPKFLLKYGKEYVADANTYKGSRATPKNCYGNCTHIAMDCRDLAYVEGYVSVYGVPIQHAWLTNAKGNLIDPTLVDGGDRANNYFGVAFDTDYLYRANKKNKYYGLLDGYYNRKTIIDLLSGKVKINKWQSRLHAKETV
jgi:hypothetical protein